MHAQEDGLYLSAKIMGTDVNCLTVLFHSIREATHDGTTKQNHYVSKW